MSNSVKKRNDVCSHSHAVFLDNIFRRLLQNPAGIVGRYIQKGSIIIDLGCGPGFFTLDMARMTGPSGKVFAVDLQPEMLADVQKKAEKYNLTKQIILHQCSETAIELTADVKADFILAFYMVHETPDPLSFLSQIRSLLNKNGRFLLVEPWFHVTKSEFNRLIQDAETAGFNILKTESKISGRSLLLG